MGKTMRLTLRFKLPEEQDEFVTATNAGKYSSIIHELNEWMRGQVKYLEFNENTKGIQESRNKLLELIDHYNVSQDF